MDPVSAIGLTASIVQLIDTTTKVVKYIQDVKKATEDRGKLAQEIASLLGLFYGLKYKVESADIASPWFKGILSLGAHDGPLDRFKQAMEDLARKLEPNSGLKALGKRLIWPLEKKDCNEILSKIERVKTLVGLALQEDNL
jgi:hypothetical protein